MWFLVETPDGISALCHRLDSTISCQWIIVVFCHPSQITNRMAFITQEWCDLDLPNFTRTSTPISHPATPNTTSLATSGGQKLLRKPLKMPARNNWIKFLHNGLTGNHENSHHYPGKSVPKMFQLWNNYLLASAPFLDNNTYCTWNKKSTIRWD